ncbi:polyprenyl synthetase family protein [bacterium]|nr:polyprenyl synthetase family protein [bacterium]
MSLCLIQTVTKSDAKNAIKPLQTRKFRHHPHRDNGLTCPSPASTFAPMLAAHIKEAVAETPSEAPNFPSRPDWRSIVEPVSGFLSEVADQLAAQIDSFHPDLREHARYALTNQGKQLRPALMALAARSFARLNADHVKAAVIVEMVHLATLVHDDIMDEAEVRRSRPTVAQRWGNEQAVLLGDCLFAHALKLAASFPTTDICRAVAGATKNVCSGEILQTQKRFQFNLSQREYLQMLAMKTGELFALSCDLGAFLCGIRGEHRDALRNYGMALGTAYQLFDDCVDLFGSERSAGKSLGTDLAKGKLTLPILLGLARASGADRAELEQLLMHWDHARLPRLQALLDRYDAFDGAQVELQRYLAEARQNLEPIASVGRLQELTALLDYLAQQSSSLGVINQR